MTAAPARFSLRSSLARFRGERRGSAAVEFAMLAIPFFIGVFAILETSLLFMAELTLDKAAAEIGRQVRTGRLHSGQLSAADFRKLVCEEVKVMLDCGKVQVDMRSYATFADVAEQMPVRGNDIDTSGFGYDSGRSSAVVALRIYYKWPIITNLMRPYLSNTGDGGYLIVGSTVFRTEPF